MRLALINMPFGRVDFPSIALAQIRAVLTQSVRGKVDIEEYHFNHDFAQYFGMDCYKILLGNSVYIKRKNQVIQASPYRRRNGGLFEEREFSGAGDWIFRELAFPGIEDNHTAYFAHYFQNAPQLSQILLEKKAGLGGFLLQLVEKYNLLQCDVLCMTSMFQQHMANLALANYVKDRNPSVCVVMGGPNLDAASEWVHEIPTIDYALRGDGLVSIVQLIRCLLDHNTNEIQHIPGLYYKGRPFHGETHGENRSLTEPLLLDYHAYLHSLREHFPDGSVQPVLFLETSKGCWWADKVKCTFCDCFNHHTEFEPMEASCAVRYINTMLNEYQEECQYFWAVDAAIPKDYCHTVLPFINKGKKAELFYEVRAELNEAQIKSLAEANVCMVQSGIEALHTDLLRFMKKGTTVFTNLAFLMNTCLDGVSVLWNLLAGIEGETLFHYKAVLGQIDRLRHLYPPTGMWPISYDKYSDYVRRNERYQVEVVPDTRVLTYLYPFREETLQKMAYFYQNVKPEKTYPYQIMKAIGHINKKIGQWTKLWKENQMPMLYRCGDTSIFDSRNGTSCVHELTVEEIRQLEMLEQPKTKKELSCSSLLARLDQMGLVWCENDRFISLVLKEKPRLPMTYQEMRGWQFE